ncbi:MAG: FGGY-family carbohydrate kinase [Lachnospiraceae bacterium]|jgi:xylulokinase|nr:FGGY-family carbohydrate kinase [Lachnospiraceae bacterium]
MGQYLLGIDIGTSACKAALFSSDGNVIANALCEYPVYYPKQGFVEQDPNDWWKGTCSSLRDISEAMKERGISPEEIAGIGIDGQGWAAVAVDGKGNVLCNNPIWLDTRAADICKEINIKIGSEKLFELCGNPLSPTYTTAKILWYEKNLPDVFAKTEKILQSNSFIAMKLAGTVSQDICQSYGYHCFDMRKGVWDFDMCEALGIPKKFLPKIYACHEIVGTLSKEAARETGLIPGIPVAAGGLDAACGSLGAGVLRAGDTQEQGGQAGGMSICTDEYLCDERLILSFHVVPGRWLLQGGSTGGGGVMRWLERELGSPLTKNDRLPEKKVLEIFNEMAAKVPAGSDGVVFLPYMAGERSPIWNPNAKGVYYGLDFNKTKGHFIRAGMEGVAFSLRHNLEVAQHAGASVNELRAMGGSANSLLWTQIKSDVTGKPVVVPASDTATTLGAAILAGVGVGVYSSFEEAVDKIVVIKRKHEPNAALKSIYDKNYEVYRKLYEKLEELFV